MKAGKRIDRLAQMERLAEVDNTPADEATSREAMTAKLMRIARVAEAKGDLGAARAALMDVAKLNGLVIDRAENTSTVFTVSDEPMTAEEWAEKYGEQEPRQ